MIKNFLMKQAFKIGSRNMPKDQQEMMLRIVEKKPELFENIAKEVKALTDAGKPEMYASFEVMQKYQAEITALLQGEDIEKIKQIARDQLGGAANDDSYDQKKAA